MPKLGPLTPGKFFVQVDLTSDLIKRFSHFYKNTCSSRLLTWQATCATNFQLDQATCASKWANLQVTWSSRQKTWASRLHENASSELTWRKNKVHTYSTLCKELKSINSTVVVVTDVSYNVEIYVFFRLLYMQFYKDSLSFKI